MQPYNPVPQYSDIISWMPGKAFVQKTFRSNNLNESPLGNFWMTRPDGFKNKN